MIQRCTKAHKNGTIPPQIARFMGPTWGPPGSCRPQMGPHVGPMNLAIGDFHGEVPVHLVCLQIGVGHSLCYSWGAHSGMCAATPSSKVHGANMGPSGADRTQVGPMLAPWTLLSGKPWEEGEWVFVWGAIHYHGKSCLVFIEWTLTWFQYTDHTFH